MRKFSPKFIINLMLKIAQMIYGLLVNVLIQGYRDILPITIYSQATNTTTGEFDIFPTL